MACGIEMTMTTMMMLMVMVMLKRGFFLCFGSGSYEVDGGMVAALFGRNETYWRTIFEKKWGGVVQVVGVGKTVSTHHIRLFPPGWGRSQAQQRMTRDGGFFRFILFHLDLYYILVEH